MRARPSSSAILGSHPRTCFNRLLSLLRPRTPCGFERSWTFSERLPANVEPEQKSARRSKSLEKREISERGQALPYFVFPFLADPFASQFEATAPNHRKAESHRKVLGFLTRL